MAAPAADRTSVARRRLPGPRRGGPSASDASLRQVVDGVREGVVLRDANGVIVYVNAAAERILRRARAVLVGGESVNSGGVREDGTPFLPSGSVSSTALATGRDRSRSTSACRSTTASWLVLVNARVCATAES